MGADGGVGGEGGSGGDDECEDNEHTVLAWAPKAWALAVEDGHVYFTTHELDGIVARMTTEGTTLQLIATGQRYPHQVAASGEQAFWVALGPEPGHVFQSSVMGTDRQQIATGILNGIFSLTSDATHVYLTTNINVLGSVPIGGGTPVILSGGPFNSVIVDMVRQGPNLFWANTGVSVFTPTQPGTATIFSADPAVPSVSPLVTRLDYPQFQVTANDENVFWSDESAIYRTARIGGTYETVTSLPAAPPDQSPIVDMVSDDEFVFYTDGKALYRVPSAGGSAELVSDGWERITQLDSDETSLYFTDSVRGAVVKVAKCADADAVASKTVEAALAASTTDDSRAVLAAPACPSTPGPHGCPEPTVAATVPGAFGLALDRTHLYVSSFGTSGSVLRAPLAGGTPEPLATGENNPHDLTVDDENVYFCLHYDASPGRIAKVPKAGGLRQLLAQGNFNYGVGRVTSDGTFVYYVTSFNAVYRVFAAGGTPTILAAGPYNSNVVDLAEDGGEIFWVNDGIWNSNYTAKLPDTAYVARGFVSGSSNLGRVTLKEGLDPQYRLTVDRTNVYFIDGSFVYKTSRAGGPTVELAPIAPASGTIVDMHTDGQHVYFADLTGVYRVPVGGGSVETLTSGWGSLRSIALSNTDVYFTDFAGGAVLKRPK
jgi:hypothetical protein